MVSSLAPPDPAGPHGPRAGAALQAVRAPLGRARRQLKRSHNRLLRAVHEDAGGGHLVPAPVFVLCPSRSGSTLLRSMLNMHTQICAPHELHLGTLRVESERAYAWESWSVLGMAQLDLENMLWDRMLHRVLVRSGKRLVVDKTPQNAMIWPRIHEFWPQARYLHLHRHPGSIFDSLMRANPARSRSGASRTVLDYGHHLDAARAALPGPTVRYEDLVGDPEATLRTLCHYLGVRPQDRMLTYRPTYPRVGLGDWSTNIRTGRVQAARALPAPDAMPAELRTLAAGWGY